MPPFLRTTFFRLTVGLAAFFCIAPASGSAAEAAVAEPDEYKTDNYQSPVPRTLKGARVITGEEAEALWRAKSAVFVDVYPRAPKPPNLPAGTVWRDPSHRSIEGAYWLPNVGYGVLSLEAESYFKSKLQQIAAEHPQKPVVFFCLRDCWMSWNAAKRALEWGYRDVIWFPDGTDRWQEIGFDLVHVEPMP